MQGYYFSRPIAEQQMREMPVSGAGIEMARLSRLKLA
jgi:EAL domain-containing protein (putative c-di-GMP-specific phosphodiesterase class I)